MPPHYQVSRSFRLISALVALAMCLAPIASLVPSVYAAETITIEPTQAVYLVNNGDTANVGFKMTYTGTPDSGTGLDRDITLVITTGASLQVGGVPGNAQNVATTLAGGSTTIAGGSTTLVAGSTTLAAASSSGVSDIKVGSVNNFAAGQTVNIDTGANFESAVIATVGVGGSTTLGWPTAIGDTNLKVPSVNELCGRRYDLYRHWREPGAGRGRSGRDGGSHHGARRHSGRRYRYPRGQPHRLCGGHYDHRRYRC